MDDSADPFSTDSGDILKSALPDEPGSTPTDAGRTLKYSTNLKCLSGQRACSASVGRRRRQDVLNGAVDKVVLNNG